MDGECKSPVDPVFDRRKDLGGKRGLHALIIGVSAYPHLPTTPPPEPEEKRGPPDFGLRPLAATSLAAFELYRWLIRQKDQLDAPLATCWLLLSPSEEEFTAEQGLRDLAPLATKANLMVSATEWRSTSARSPDDMTLFYFAGHGIQRSDPDDHILLMHDFGWKYGPPLSHGVSTVRLISSMAPAGPCGSIARNQFFFVDACRNEPRAFGDFRSENIGDVLQIHKNPAGENVDDRIKPTYFATIPGKPAYEIKGKQTVFSKALIDCLNGDAAEEFGPEDSDGQRKWCVTSYSLGRALKARLKEVSKGQLVDQTRFGTAELHEPIVLHRLNAPPTVTVSLHIVPSSARHFTSVSIRSSVGKLVRPTFKPVEPHPYKMVLAAGNYNLIATVDPPTEPYANVWCNPRVCPTDEETKKWIVRVGQPQ